MDYDMQKILIVDDSPLILNVLSNILRDDYMIIQATTGEDALKKAVKELPDLIILDIIMQGMDGYNVCKKIKEDPLTKNIPVIFISGLNEMNDERKGLEVGAIDYITKPFSEPIVKIRVKNHLELKRHRDILEKLSSLDGLTGIFNRRYFNENFINNWNRAVRDRKLISILMIDIDKFKDYNDHYGHLAGDEALKKVAQMVGISVRKRSDFAARYGGEEFVCLLCDTDYDEALEIAKSIESNVAMLDLPHEFSDVSNIVTVSIGVGSIIPKTSHNPMDFLNSVDKLLYSAKRNGRNQIQSSYIVLE